MKLTVLLALLLTACCYTHETASRCESSRTQLAFFTNVDRKPGVEKTSVSPEWIKTAGLGAAAWIKSWLATVGIALPDVSHDVVGWVSKPVDALTTTTATAAKGQ